ncbi:DUF2207 domain-containing protein, partial [Patescibacteria group bacterium]|nr:DUF2207 domain-containing protein [Patescibacteria group bacterium]
PDSFVQGEKTYVIKYKVWRALGFFDDHVELYWNVTGNEWQEPILKSSFEITLPEKIDQSKLRQACYTGAAGSTQNFCLGEITGDNQVSFKLEQGFFLKSNQGLTAVLSWPPGIVQPVSKIQEYRWILEDNLGTIYAFVAPVAAFVLLFIFWFRRGRDPQGKGTIIARFYPPEDLTAQEVGTIVDEKADNVDISSLIISLAVKGYLKIKELPGKKIFGLTTGKDYLFTQLAQDISKLEDFEKKFLTAVFDAAKETKLSDLKNKFYKQLPEIRQALYQSTVDKGYFPKNPEKTRGAFIGLGVAAAVLGLIFGFALFQSGFAAVANLIIGLMIIVFGFFMPRRTAKGVNAKEHILGLKEYLGVAEADRIKFHNAPEKKPETFEKLLPFAMVLGVEKQWAKQFEDIYQNPPQWFEGSAPDHFSSFYLVNSLFSLQNAANAAFVSSPGGGAGSGGSGFSSGGGSSGGGFGGGGGGSW